MKKYLRKSLYLLIFVFGIVETTQAQQLPIYNQYNFNQFVYNPALSSRTDVPVLTLLHRNQWAGVSGGPETSLISFNGVESDKKIGYAAYLYYDKTGVLATTSFYGNYSFRFTLANDFNVTLGLSAGVVNQGVDMAALNVTDPSDPIVNADISGRTIFDFNAGINFSYKGFDLGFAAPQMFSNPIDYAPDDDNLEAALQLQRHYVGNLSYTYDFEMKSLGSFGKGMSLVPQVIVRAAPLLDTDTIGVAKKPTEYNVQYDAHLMLNLRNLGWIGGGYRSDMGAIANVGVNLTKDLSVGYAYEFNTSDVSSQLGTTHELALVYKFGNSKRLMDEMQLELARTKAEEIQLMNDMEEKYAKEQDSLALALRGDIVINANEIIKINDRLDNMGDEVFEEEDDISTTASHVIAGSKGFYVVSGVFAYRENAEEQYNKLQAEGYDVEYFFNKANRFYYVFLRKYKTYRMALRMRNNHINGTYYDDLWVKEIK
jgi:type IX secretion system PorP/SprF family membrane protein